MSKRQLVAIWIGHMKISLAPRRVSRGFRAEPSFVQICPKTVNVGDVEDQPPPLGSGFALFQIEYGIGPVFMRSDEK